MEQALDKTKPATSYRQTYRRHRKLFYAPIILGALAAAVFLFVAGQSYKSTASLWVDTTPPTQTSVGAGGTALAEPPASAEQGILNELLTTGSFASSVAKHSSLGKSLGSAAAIRKNAPALLGAGQVMSTVEGNQVLQISYTASSPSAAKSVLAAVVSELRNYTSHLTSQHDRAAVAYNAQQVKSAQMAVTTARSNVAAYQARHPGVTQTDPNYVALVAAENTALTQLGQANTALAQAGGTGGAGGWSIEVTDPPTDSGSAALGKKKILGVILGGALGGLLVSFLAVVALTPAKKEVWEDELPTPDPFRAGSPGAPPVPAWSNPGPAAMRQPRLSLGDRRFQFRAPSAPAEDQ